MLKSLRSVFLILLHCTQVRSRKQKVNIRCSRSRILHSIHSQTVLKVFLYLYPGDDALFFYHSVPYRAIFMQIDTWSGFVVSSENNLLQSMLYGSGICTSWKCLKAATCTRQTLHFLQSRQTTKQNSSLCLANLYYLEYALLLVVSSVLLLRSRS